MMQLSITFVGVLQLLGMWAAFMLGRHTERPKDKWPPGSLLQGGWKAWHVPLIIIAAVAALATLFLPILGGMGMGGLFGGLFGGMGMGMRRPGMGYGGGMGGAGYGQRMGYGGGGMGYGGGY